ncbi:MAG: sigma-54-dependent Fis family transcriptional regulator [Deltaproteobacteria bacterium]|nr:sigma-54-dependent Fis family transcriptional regulator [Deltaproteobacteria bacterium]
MAEVVVRNNHDNTERRVALLRAISRIGGSEDHDIYVSGAPSDLANIVKSGDGFTLSALDGPVLVNGKKEWQKALSPGDRISIGKHEIEFRLEAAADAEAPAAAAPVTMSREQEIALKAYASLNDFSARLLRNFDLREVLSSVMDTVVELCSADKGFVVLFEDGQPKVEVARNIRHENITDAVSQLSDSVIAKVVKSRSPLLVADALNNDEFKASQSVVNLKLSSVMCVPLTELGEMFGLLYVGSNRVLHQFDSHALNLLTVFASQASLLIQNAQRFRSLEAEREALKTALEQQRFGSIIGTCEAMQDVFRKIRKVAPTDISVLITGETGTGKELIAREIHQRSDRKDGPFVVINCGAIPENLLESELFGHVRGAFTGAVATKPGKFQLAHKGTLFLDEIGELPLQLQVKLLRALQEKMVTKVGDTKAELVDIRVVAATNKDLDVEMKKGQFREDLFYRLNVVHIDLPPLRERGDDILAVARFFLSKYTKEYESKLKGFTPQAVIAMRKYRWPGNIRQLENRIKKGVIMAERAHLAPEDLDIKPEDMDPILPLNEAAEAFKQRYINEVLLRNGGNRTKTARDLGVDPRTVFRHLEKMDDEEQPSEV